MTKYKKTVCFIGGDERQRYAAEKLSEYINVHTAGQSFAEINRPNIEHYDNPIMASAAADAIILPLPAAASEQAVPFSDLMNKISKKERKPLILGGKFSPYLRGLLENADIKYIDYYDDECFTLKNAFVTAEGALSLAMNYSKGTLGASKCAVLGYGRIGKALSSMLKSLNAEVTVWARREESLVLAHENGHKTQKLTKDALSSLIDTDIIFNTVPERIVADDILLTLPRSVLLIELASLPGGFDPDIALQCELKVIDGKGLPGKYAPKAAGQIVADTLITYLKLEDIL